MELYKQGCLSKYITPKPYVYKKQSYDNNIFCFDIETSSAWINDNLEIIPFKKEIKSKEYNRYVPLSLVYIWQFSINDNVLYGRYLEDFATLIDELETLVERPTIWIHNASYEFQFLLNIFKFDKVFARKAHKVIYADRGNVRFRCSYFLTRLSLADWAADTGKVKKLVGSLDYNRIRTPNSRMTVQELLYCEYDCLCMYYGLLKFVEKYTYIENIPLTQTGEVRRAVKKMYQYDYNWHNRMTQLIPKSLDEYMFMKAAFQGGYTHGNYLYANRTVYDVKSKDISSSYPTVMICEKFPMSAWTYVRPYELDKYRNEKYSLLLDVTLYDVKPKMSFTYISTSKCYDYDKDENGNATWKTDNGRLLKGKWVSMKITNVDLDIIEKCYDIGKIKYNKILKSVNDYLPRKFIAFILELYANKTTLKDVIGKEAIYMAAKQMLNSLYGMMVTDLIPSDYDFIDYKWQKTTTEVNEALDELRCKPWKNFTAYQHGIFITAYARRNLWKIITQISDDIVYVDTDSVKYVGEHEDIFEQYNKDIIEKIKLAMDELKLNFEATHPKTPKGKEKQIGIFDTEKPYYKFRTLGAKRYCYVYYPSENRISHRNIKARGKAFKSARYDYGIHVTVSGVSKKKGGRQLKSIEQFTPNLVFDTDHSGKMTFKYLSDMPAVIWQDGKEDEYISHQKFGINALPSTYSMSLSNDYSTLLLFGLQDYLKVSTSKRSKQNGIVK